MTEITLQDYAFNLTRAAGEPMKAATIAYAVLTARAMLPKDHAARIEPRDARLAVEELEKVTKKALADGAKAQFGEDALKNENTIAAVVATFPKAHATLEKMFGKAAGAAQAAKVDNGQAGEGERSFWQEVLFQSDHTAMVAFVLSQLKTNASPFTGETWDGTWAGLRAYVGFKPAKKKTALAKLGAALKKAEKDIDAGALTAFDSVFGAASDTVPSMVEFILTHASADMLGDMMVRLNRAIVEQQEAQAVAQEAIDTFEAAAA
jgi:hypothetical protein